LTRLPVRDELAHRAAIDEVEEAHPGRREALKRVIDAPIRIFVGSMSILPAPHAEGHRAPVRGN
jgi:hypothetical protein